MSDTVQKIKERLSIFDVVAPYVELQKAGKNYKGKSPFTNEKTPSFYVSPDRGMYYCFSSNQGGDIFTFIEKMEGVDFKGALKILADKAGVEIVREDPKKRTERDTQYALIEEATAFFFKQGTLHKPAQDYILGRGVDGKTLHTWRIGYAPDEWRSLRSHLTEKGYTDAQMLRTGLIKKADGGKEPYDVFRNRIMFPIWDTSGRVVAFSGRTLSKDKEIPKYVNSPETELYQKSDILFGYDKAKQGIRRLDFSLITEGQFDVVLAHQAGYGNTVAVSGTALTSHHIDLLERLSNRVVLALDSDRAGIAAANRAAEMMLSRGMDIKVVEMPEGKDPADIIKEDAKEFKHVVGKAVHVVEFLLNVLEKESKDERAYKLRVREEVLPLLARMPNKIDREHFEKVIAERLDTTKDGVHYEVERFAEKIDRTEEPVSEKESQKEIHEGVRYDEVAAFLSVGADILMRGEHKDLGALVKEKLKTILGEDMDIDKEKGNKLAFALEDQLANYSEREVREEFGEKLTELSLRTAKKRIAEFKKELQTAERAGDMKKVEALLQQMQSFQSALDTTVIL
ncbi:DNA primase [Candidatus Kaiserbacteria bacterium]|nr:DNA primase [Candidatus Kaiserbacteria bacterium]